MLHDEAGRKNHDADCTSCDDERLSVIQHGERLLRADVRHRVLLQSFVVTLLLVELSVEVLDGLEVEQSIGRLLIEPDQARTNERGRNEQRAHGWRCALIPCLCTDSLSFSFMILRYLSRQSVVVSVKTKYRMMTPPVTAPKYLGERSEVA